MSNKTVVLAIFKDEISADAAAASLKESGVAKGDAIGVLVLNEKGELKADKVGKRSWGKGAGIGAVVADFLREQGGTPESHPVSDEAVEEAQTAATAEQS